MSDATTYTFAAWVACLRAAGICSGHAATAAAADALMQTREEEAARLAGEALVEAVAPTVGEDLLESAQAHFGDLAGRWMEGSDRAARLRSARRHSFGMNLPWLAKLWERRPDGTVEPAWVLVERLVDLACLLDPNPWDDLPEDRDLSASDFAVLWELAGCEHVAVLRG